MTCLRFQWRVKNLAMAPSTPRANYWLCDTEADRPATAYQGDFCFTRDSNKLWKRTDAAWVEVGGGVAGPTDWSDIINKPATFPPDAHNHNADIAAAV